MPTVGTTSRPGYVYDQGTDTWIPIGVGPHSHDTSSLVPYSGFFAAGKNKFINGDFGIWQRGTSISLSNSTRAYGPDRFAARSFFSAGSSTFSQQTFSPGTAPVAGYEGQYFARISCGSTATAWQFDQRIEDVRTFAGQTVTFSFWIKASANNASTTIEVVQNFGSGGSANVTTNATGPSVTTSWQRFSVTLAIPSVSGKTIGTGSYVEFSVYSNSGVTNSMTVDTWGWQVEAGSVATPFQTATGTLAGELLAAQRYYWRQTGNSAYSTLGNGYANSTTNGFVFVQYPVILRNAPTAVEWQNLAIVKHGSAVFTITTLAVGGTTESRYGALLEFTCSGGGLTNNVPYHLSCNNNNAGFIGFSAEL
jgi:hypothetical protein